MANEPILPTDPVRDNPTVRSKFDKSQGKGLPAPHLSHPGQTTEMTNERVDRVRLEPKNVDPRQGDASLHKVTMHHPSTLGTAMAEGRSMTGNPNVAQSDKVGKSHTLTMDRFAGREPDPVRAGSDKHSGKNDTQNPGRYGSEKSHADRSRDGNKVSRGSAKQGPGVLHANKRGSGPNLK